MTCKTGPNGLAGTDLDDMLLGGEVRADVALSEARSSVGLGPGC